MTNHNSDDCNNEFKREFGVKITIQAIKFIQIQNSKFIFGGIAFQQIYFGNRKTDSFVMDSGASCPVANDLKLMTKCSHS